MSSDADQRRKPPPISAIPGREPAARRLRPRRLRRTRAGAQLPDPLMWGPRHARQADHQIAEGSHQRLRLRAGVRQNVPPAHFGYMASGIDDEVTLRANREGFLKFQLRPRRLVDVSKVDMSVDILGAKYDSPIVVAPIGGQSSSTPTAKSRRRPRRQGRQPSADPLDPTTHLGRGGHRGARRADLVSALRHQQVRGRQGHHAARRERRLHRRGGHRRPQRRTQPGNAVPAAPERHARLQRLPRPLEPAGQLKTPADVPRASTSSGLTNTQSSAMTWDYLQAACATPPR